MSEPAGQAVGIPPSHGFAVQQCTKVTKLNMAVVIVLVIARAASWFDHFDCKNEYIEAIHDRIPYTITISVK
jgi:hypothetical protein